MNEFLIVGIGAIAILLIIYVILKLCGKFRNKVYQLFLKAEKTVKSGEKMDYVLNNIYDYLPRFITIFISRSLLRKIVQKMFDVVSDFLNDGKINGK